MFERGPQLENTITISNNKLQLLFVPSFFFFFLCFWSCMFPIECMSYFPRKKKVKIKIKIKKNNPFDVYSAKHLMTKCLYTLYTALKGVSLLSFGPFSRCSYPVRGGSNRKSLRLFFFLSFYMDLFWHRRIMSSSTSCLASMNHSSNPK